MKFLNLKESSRIPVVEPLSDEKETETIVMRTQAQGGAEQEVVEAQGDFKTLGPGVQIVMNGEPLQIISVDGSTGQGQEIQVDADGRHFINAHDGQPLELVVQSDGTQHVYDEDMRTQSRLVKIAPTWSMTKGEGDRIHDQGDGYARIVMMNEEPDARKYNLLVSGGSQGHLTPGGTAQQIIYTEASGEKSMASVVMASTSPQAMIQTVAVNPHHHQHQEPSP